MKNYITVLRLKGTTRYLVSSGRNFRDDDAAPIKIFSTENRAYAYFKLKTEMQEKFEKQPYEFSWRNDVEIVRLKHNEVASYNVSDYLEKRQSYPKFSLDIIENENRNKENAKVEEIFKRYNLN